ncbi:MAG: esterase/lipase family protein [Flammeovirgaceae bacterium]
MLIGNEKIEKPSKFWLFTESGRALFDLGTYFASGLIWKNLPQGDGHPVLIFPGFLASDLSTGPLRRFLSYKNYSPQPWKLGRNLGDYEVLEERMSQKIEQVHKRFQQKVSIIGWSLGGVFAREMAKKLPHCVRRVITLGSPFGGIRKPNNAAWIFELLSGKQINEIEYDGIDEIPTPPPVPSTAIYSKSDGIVPWQCCMEIGTGRTENVEIVGAHLGLGHNPAALICIADRLAQPEGEWQPFVPTGYQRLFFPAY